MRRARYLATVLAAVAMLSGGPHWANEARADSIVNYAVLFGGGIDSSFNAGRYYWDLQGAYNVLVDDWGYRPENVIVLFADGQSPQVDQYRLDANGNEYHVNSNPDLNGDSVREIRPEPATRANLQAALADLGQRMNSDDTLLMWTTDHGGREWVDNQYQGYMWGWGDDQQIWETDLASWTEGLPAWRQTYVFGFCNSGEFVDAMSGPNRMILTAASPSEASNAQWGIPSDPATDYDEFLHQWDIGLVGGAADANGDGFVSTYESFLYARDHDPFYVAGTEHPQWDDPSGIGASYTLTGETPEPSSLAVLLAGVIGIGYLAWKRKRPMVSRPQAKRLLPLGSRSNHREARHVRP
jgi:hypothetical protein